MKFTAAQRLRLQADFVRAREEGLRMDCGPFFLNAFPAPAGVAAGGVANVDAGIDPKVSARSPDSTEGLAPTPALTRFGVVSAKKLLGCAVRRNRARRVFREIFRLHPDVWPEGWDVVAVPKRSMFGKSFASLESRYLECAARLKERAVRVAAAQGIPATARQPSSASKPGDADAGAPA
ncbi:MAG: ribonuclease P protein component [Puniceicoccales bacterium]|jgi:ribonuclease P protein component|nr:ribonuclease P protein component [Puniceicoccales bacterium]